MSHEEVMQNALKKWYSEYKIFILAVSILNGNESAVDYKDLVALSVSDRCW